MEAVARLAPDDAAVSRASRLAQSFAATADLTPRQAGDLAMIVEEWVANVVEHGGPHSGSRIILQLTLETGAVRVAVSDAGVAFDPRTAAFQGPNPHRGGGAGLAMIASLCRLAGYTRSAGRNRLLLRLPLD